MWKFKKKKSLEKESVKGSLLLKVISTPLHIYWCLLTQQSRRYPGFVFCEWTLLIWKCFKNLSQRGTWWWLCCNCRNKSGLIAEGVNCVYVVFWSNLVMSYVLCMLVLFKQSHIFSSCNLHSYNSVAYKHHSPV